MKKVETRRVAKWTMGILAAATAAASAKGPSVQVVTFTIDATTPQAVFSDGHAVSAPAPYTDSADTYKDFRLTAGTVADPNYCVEASPDNSGSLFVRLNRKLDGDAGFQYCQLYAPGATQRQFTLHITEPAACDELVSTSYISAADLDANGGCFLTGSDKPRIRLTNLYARTAKSTPVAFLTLHYDGQNPGGVSYEVQTDTDAVVSVVGNSNTRQVRYNGRAHLVRFVDGVSGSVAVQPSFDLPFQMTFVKQ